MSPRLSNIPTPSVTTKLSGLELLANVAESLAHKDPKEAPEEMQGYQTQCMSNDAVAGCSSIKDRTIGDLSIKVTGASETGIADAEKEKHQRSKTFQSSMNLEQHTGNVHVTRSRKKDQDCENTFKNEEYLDVHSKNQRSGHNKKHQCKQCSRILYSLKGLKRHMKTVHVKEPRKECPDCKITFKNKQSLEAHCRNKHGNNNKFPCNQCTRVFPYRYNLKRHKKEMHMAKTRKKCPDCGKTFKLDRYLDMHRHKKHNGCKDTHKCDQCNKKFSFATYLQQHIRTVHTTASYKECPDCKHKFKNKRSLSKHRINKHSGCKKKHTCDKCEKAFQYPFNLKRHIKNVHMMKLERRKEGSNYEAKLPMPIENKKSLYTYI